MNKATRKPARRPSRMGSLEARRKASVVLEVLAGIVAAQEAATALGISMPKYYVLESRALDGFIQGCEPRKPGKAPGVEKEAVRLKRENGLLQRQLMRAQALLRASHKAVGVVVPRPKEERGKRRRKPTVRALKFARLLRKEGEPAAVAENQAKEAQTT